MAPRTYAARRKTQAYRASKPAASTYVHTRVGRPAHRSKTHGTVIQLETIAPLTPPRSQYSPSSRTKPHLTPANKLNLPEELAAVRRTVNNRHAKDVSNARSIPLQRATSPGLELTDIDYASSPEDIENIIEQITDYFDFWSNTTLREGPASLLADFRLINRRLGLALGLFENVTSSYICGRAKRDFQDIYARFVETWSRATYQALVDKLDRLLAQLRARITHRFTVIHEIEFTLFDLDVGAVSPCSSLQALLGSTCNTVPFLVSADQAEELVDRAEKLLFAFQDVTYDTEAKELWLLIWRSLKRVFAAFDQGGAPTSPTNTLRDRLFFEIPKVRRELKRLNHTTEAANSASIESIVGEYCRYIHSCPIDPDNKYESLQRTQDTPLGQHTKNALRQFIKTGKFETSTLSKLHFAVARFNKINGGPVMVSRWRSPHDNGVWDMIPMYLDSPVSVQASSATEDRANVQHTSQPSSPLNSYSPALDTSRGITEKPAKRVFPYPEGISIKSDFDYVWYPSPETRAHEVVQNEQISRELAQPGIVSAGPRPEYLIDRPPRHVRDPTQFAERSLGPLSFIRHAIQQLIAKKRGLPDIKTPTFSRLPMHQQSLPVGSASAILGRKARVQKPVSSGQVSGLRGGKGRPLHWSTGLSRRHHFDAAAFHRKMVSLSIRELRRRYGGGIPIDLAEILKLLPRTGYDIQEVAMRYISRGRGPRLTSISTSHGHSGTRPSDQTAVAGQSKHLPPVYERCMDEHARVSKYRVNNSPRATVEGWEEAYLNEHHETNEDDDQENLPPGPAGVRIPLGEMQPGDYSVPQSDGSSLRRRSDSSDTPVRLRCHPCPTFEGQYHHECPGSRFCPGYEPPSPAWSPTSPSYPFDYDRNHGEERWSSEDEHRYSSDEDQGHEQDNGGGLPVDNKSEDSLIIYEDDHQAGGPDAGHNGDEAGHNDYRSQGENATTPPAAPAAEDDNTVESLFGDQEGGFATVIGRFSMDSFVHIQQGFDSLDQGEINSTTGGEVVGNMIPWLESTAAVINQLRGEYLASLKGEQKPHLEMIPEEEFRSKPSIKTHPATYKLCKRAFQDVRFHHGRVLQFFDYTHPRTLLSFRYAFNALIVAVRELLLLLREYHRSLVGPGIDNGDERGDDHDQPTYPPRSPSNDSVVTPPISKVGYFQSPVHKDVQNPHETVKNAPSGPRPNPLPARKDYENMFVPELCRELEQNRGIKDVIGALGKKNPVKKDYIDKLMALDQEGIVGKGATECYRNITGNWNARGTPKNWNIETALKGYYERLAREKEAMSSPRGSQRPSQRGNSGSKSLSGSSRSVR
ncbi:hypothetical protein G647_01454 [Cladophialophora carrionii CBS 160.54]|uniref:Uncharacterized protein n=1 Tax=Cladophialophora carrionii CBS 160.54 TaxID=1279043 RepID=V9DSQ8_9EURO|nr:uncharacterized protein G647_01454 [Cladophialophora carrionii CBS 160.54]ETI29002.1 hypothetical protein G647_01454 [Cladophialophora carrionii CBS 160.54]